MYVKTTSVFGFLQLRTLAALRRLRRMTARFDEEQTLIDRWLAAVTKAGVPRPRPRARDRALRAADQGLRRHAPPREGELPAHPRHDRRSGGSVRAPTPSAPRRSARRAKPRSPIPRAASSSSRSRRSASRRSRRRRSRSRSSAARPAARSGRPEPMEVSFKDEIESPEARRRRDLPRRGHPRGHQGAAAVGRRLRRRLPGRAGVAPARRHGAGAATTWTSSACTSRPAPTRPPPRRCSARRSTTRCAAR